MLFCIIYKFLWANFFTYVEPGGPFSTGDPRSRLCHLPYLSATVIGSLSRIWANDNFDM